MRYFEDENFIKKQLYDAESGNIDKLLKRYFILRRKDKID